MMVSYRLPRIHGKLLTRNLQGHLVKMRLPERQLCLVSSSAYLKTWSEAKTCYFHTAKSFRIIPSSHRGEVCSDAIQIIRIIPSLYIYY